MIRNKKYRLVDITIPVYVLEKIATGNRDELVDYLNYKLYNAPEFFDGITREDIVVNSKTIKGQFAE